MFYFPPTYVLYMPLIAPLNLVILNKLKKKKKIKKLSKKNNFYILKDILKVLLMAYTKHILKKWLIIRLKKYRIIKTHIIT